MALRALTEALAPRLPKAGAIVKRRFDRRLWLARQSGAHQRGLVGVQGSPTRRRSPKEFGVGDRMAIPSRRSVAAMDPARRPSRPPVQTARAFASMRQSRPGLDPDPERVSPPLFGDAPRRRRHRPRRPRRRGPDIAPVILFPVLGRRALDQRRQRTRRRRVGSVDQRGGASGFLAPRRSEDRREINCSTVMTGLVPASQPNASAFGDVVAHANGFPTASGCVRERGEFPANTLRPGVAPHVDDRDRPWDRPGHDV